MGGGGDARNVIDLLIEAESMPFQGQLRPLSPDTRPGIQNFQEILPIIASSDQNAH